MKDINYPLRKAYNTALETVGIPVYYQFAPNDENSTAYIVFSGIDSNDASTKSSADTDTVIEVRIHTRQDGYINGNSADTYAGLVYDAVYSTQNQVFDLSADGLQMVSTRVQSDNTLDYGVLNNQIFIDRIITFKHKIFIQ